VVAAAELDADSVASRLLDGAFTATG